MPANLYDYANQFTLGQLGGAGKGLLQGAADMLNRYGIGTRGIKTAKPQRQSERPVGTQAVLGGKPVYWGGDNYGWQQLNQTGTSATLNALNSPGALAAFTGTGSSPAERAYQTERSRVAQLTAQDPELQRYEKARAGAKTQEEMNAARDIGMQIWQQKYGNTPMGQPGGAVGMRNPLMDRTFGYQTGGAPDQQIGAPTLGPSPLVPQVDQSLNPASPNYIGGEGPPLMNFADPRFENVSPEEFQKLLNQVNRK